MREHLSGQLRGEHALSSHQVSASVARRLAPWFLGLAILGIVGGLTWVAWQPATPLSESAQEGGSASSEPTPQSEPSEDDEAGESPGESPSESSSRRASSAGAARPVAACRSESAAGAKLVASYDRGIGHWKEHVEGQTAADDGEISSDRLSAIFTRTRLAGPADMKRWAAAERAYDDVAGTCAEQAKQAAKATRSCRRLIEAQTSLIKVADPAMKDWESHLADMARSRSQAVPDAMGVWRDAWAAAPRNLDPWDKARAAYDPPSC